MISPINIFEQVITKVNTLISYKLFLEQLTVAVTFKMLFPAYVYKINFTLK